MASFTVLSAVYGALRGGDRAQAEARDVTDLLAAHIKTNDGVVTCDNVSFGDVAEGFEKHFGAFVKRDGVVYGFACAEGQKIDFKVGGGVVSTVPRPEPTGAFKVKFAVFGALIGGSAMNAKASDVTSALQALLDKNRIVACNTANFGDPAGDNKKHFAAVVVHDGREHYYACEEGQSIDFAVVNEAGSAWAPRAPKWMEKEWETIKHRRLWQLALPGTHDSACYAKRWEAAVGASLLTDTPRSRAQGVSIYRQLAYGIRHLDLRFRKCNNGVYYVVHGQDVFETTLSDVLTDIERFLDSTEKELLLLMFRVETAYPGMESKGRPLPGESCQNEVVERLGKQRILTKADVSAFGRNWPANCTLEQIIDRGKRVILLWSGTEGNDDQPASNYLWSSGDETGYFQITRPENFRSAVTVDELVEGRTRDLEWWWHNWRDVYFAHSGKFWFGLGVHLTTVIDLVGMHTEHGHHHGPQYNLEDLAEQSISVVLDKLRGDWKHRRWNLVGADLFNERQYLDFAQAVVDLNLPGLEWDLPDWQ